MMAGKIAGAVLVLCSTIGFGVVNGLDLVAYRRQLELLKCLFQMIKREIVYAKLPFEEIFAQLGRRIEGVYGIWMRELSRAVAEKREATFGEVWESSIEMHLRDSKLGEQELLRLKQLGRQMGHFDETMQIAMIDLYLEELEVTLQRTRKELHGKRRLFHCFGVLGGIFIIILLI